MMTCTNSNSENKILVELGLENNTTKKAKGSRWRHQKWFLWLINTIRRLNSHKQTYTASGEAKLKLNVSLLWATVLTVIYTNKS